MEVAIVTVGDELLAGDTANTNATWLAQQLTDRGVSITRILTVPDREHDIADALNNYRERYDAVVVTGGLGPTHDDLTMEAVASTFDRELVESEEVRRRLTESGGYEVEELAAGTTLLPAGARPLHNEVGVAPGCVIGSVYVLPGVPSEMKAMFQQVALEFDGRPVHVETVETPEPESALLDRIATVRERFDVTVGSYPGENVRLKLSGPDEEAVSTAARWLRDHVDSPN